MRIKVPKGMAKKKRIPRYLQKTPARVPAVYKAGNHSRHFTIMVPVLKTDGTIKLDGNGMIVREEVSENYEWNQKHRNQHKAGSGLWTVPENIEGIIFLKCRNNGAFCKWKGNTHMGWGVCNHQGQAQVLGQGVTSNKQMIDVKVCKFVEGNLGLWHGYPIDYRRDNEDFICDNAIHYWERLNLIDKSEITDIQSKEDSSLI